MNKNKVPTTVYSFEIKPELAAKLKKLKKKDALLFARIKKKIFEIIEHPNHYKPLKYGMKTIRRVHFDPFVLTFTLNEDKHHVEFLDFAHHDEIYL
ncbi:MAG: type II toxin-antitoxin system RelE/ParE family toxin [Candidatus Methanoperedenaceae archaeon]|nr:type II toxin-antitoxin system RelE/ParE family toxin [Candidatus Methanoperedenaceae archaeon]MDW7726912.1 type II toxin-antitoxin system RelE/ParE family toxin [Candidatus Methanoperedens sp.]